MPKAKQEQWSTIAARTEGSCAGRKERLPHPGGSYFVWVELPARVDALALHRQALARGIRVAPGPIFSAHHGFRNCLRLNYGHAQDERTRQALATLGRLIAQAAG